MALEDYKRKRDFSKTTEPKAKVKKSKSATYLIHKHNASHLHYDLRLEAEGVLKSWAVPKEPNDKDKRLAIMVEDHPLEYGKFEGTIPKGNYGAGTVEIWDKGKYENIKGEDTEDSIKKGRVEINIKGKKLNGNYALIKIRPREGKENTWLFFRMKD